MGWAMDCRVQRNMSGRSTEAVQSAKSRKSAGKTAFFNFSLTCDWMIGMPRQA
jgi:hypothetical protein